MTDTAVAIKEPAIVLTKEDIKRYICPEATDKEVFMFLGVCKSFGLNPLKRECHLIKYGNAPASIVTGYEVYLKRAERTGKLNGWKVDVAKDGSSATVTIHRKDWNQPFEWTAYRQEFDKGQANWRTMPLFMLRKVAMAQAFRICFPDEMGGLPYLPEEISGNVSESLPSGPVQELPPIPSESAPQSTEEPFPTLPPKEEKKDIVELRRELDELADIATDSQLFGSKGQAIQWATSTEKFASKCKDVSGLTKEWQIERAIKKMLSKMNAPKVPAGDDQEIPPDLFPE